MTARCLLLASCTLISLAALPALPARAQARVVECSGGAAQVEGDGGTVEVHGGCRALSVTGDNNHVTAELAPGATVEVKGDRNRVRFHLVGGTEPAHVSVAGDGDVVGPDAAPLAGTAAPATQAPLVLSTGGEARCSDRDVEIDGDGGTYTLQGGCRSLTVQGQDVVVHAEMQPAGEISVPGHRDRVFWFTSREGAPPQTAQVSSDSQVLQQGTLGTTIAPASDAPLDTGGQAPLVLTGGTSPVAADCAGRDVQILAHDTEFVLRGRCRTISVAGNNDKVVAEMLAGSRIRIEGDHSVVQFALVSEGPDPIVSVQGDGSTAWRIQRLGAESRATASQGVSPTATGMKVQGGQGASVTEMNEVPQSHTPQ